MKKWKSRLLDIAGILLVVYVVTYLGLSRRGYAESRQYNMCGFYYLPPQNSDSWRFWNYTCAYLFYPLNLLDGWLGTGMEAACEPLWGLTATGTAGEVAVLRR